MAVDDKNHDRGEKHPQALNRHGTRGERACFELVKTPVFSGSLNTKIFDRRNAQTTEETDDQF